LPEYFVVQSPEKMLQVLVAAMGPRKGEKVMA
jgi:hypothetical protein